MARTSWLLDGLIAVWFCGLAVALCVPAAAQQIAGVSVGGEAVLVQDNVGPDLDPAANSIRFNFNLAPADSGYRVQGAVRAMTVPGVSATTTLTECLIENLAGAPDPATDSLIVTHFFPAIAPITSNRASLAGSYNDVSGVGFIDSADIGFVPAYDTGPPPPSPIGPINPAAVASDPNPPVAFGGASGPVVERFFAVEGHIGTVDFDLGFFGDAIRLPDSAEISTRRLAILEIPTLQVWALFLLSLLLLAAGIWVLRTVG